MSVSKRMRRNTSAFLVVLVLISMFNIGAGTATAASAIGSSVPSMGSPTFDPNSPSKVQTKKTPVKAETNTNPQAVLYQNDARQWTYVSEGQTSYVTNEGGLPKAGEIVNVPLTRSNYLPSSFVDSSNNPYPVAAVSEPKIVALTDFNSSALSFAGGFDYPERNLLALGLLIGVPSRYDIKQPSGSDCITGAKCNITYNMGGKLTWQGDATETKEIQITGGGVTLAANQTANLTGEIRTKQGANGAFGGYSGASGQGGTVTWTSSNTSVATVSSSGVVTARTAGQTTITILWVKDGWQLTTTTNIGVGQAPNPDPGGGNNGGGSGSCTPTIGSPSQRSVATASMLNANPSGVIKADTRGSERFDVLQGIPTSESLYANAFGMSYLYQNNFANMGGKVTYNCSIDVTYHRTWKKQMPEQCNTVNGVRTCTRPPDETMEDDVPKNYSFTVERDYTYWQINNLEVYAISRATMTNYALPGGSITLSPSGYTPPSLQSANDDNVQSHVRPASAPSISFSPPTLSTSAYTPPSVPDDKAQLKSTAEAGIQDPQVKNDKVVFNGSTIMNDAWTTKTGPTPGTIPSPSMIGDNVLYRNGMVISSSLENQANTSSSGMIYYDLVPGNIKGGSSKQFSISGINTVTVHTPVVSYTSTSNDREHNQRINPSPNNAFVLDRPFTVTMPTSGQHRNIPGYGNRDYAKYFRSKQVYFEFDVYNSSKSQFFPARTWIDIPVSQEQVTFYLPVWVDEGDYNVYFRSIAENSPSSLPGETLANLSIPNHVATRIIPVNVVGRLYDFKVTDISDPAWNTVFRYGVDNKYFVGLLGIDGDRRGNSSPFTLPIMPGSHTQFKNTAVKTGYNFKFEFKTKGNMFGPEDGVRVTPTFYFVKKDGSGRVPVDLYYNNGANTLVRVGSSYDTERLNVTLDSENRRANATDMTNTANYYNYSNMYPSTYGSTYLRNAVKSTYVGKYSWLMLNRDLRTLIGLKEPLNTPSTPPGASTAQSMRSLASVQNWHGQYNLPSQVYATPMGTDLYSYGRSNDLNDKSSVFLKDGYIVVNFNIETIRNNNVATPYLRYYNVPLNNGQWKMEGYQNSTVDAFGNRFNFSDGDVVLYHADQSSSGDYSPSVTH